MRIWNFVEADDILTKLNTPPPTADATAAFIRELARTSPPEIGDEWEAYLLAVLGVSLRSLVDQWLVTGIQDDGSESLASRNLSHTSASLDLAAYLERYPARVDFAANGSELSVCIADVGALPPPTLNPYYDVGEEATRLFLGMMTSDWKERLCKCVHCGKYFLHAHPRKVYTHGTFCCRQHQSHATAVRSTKARRVRAKSELLEFAAEHLVKSKVSGPEWKKSPETRTQLAIQISRHIFKSRNPILKAYAQVVKSNWVTRNRHEIEQKRIELARSRQISPGPSGSKTSSSAGIAVPRRHAGGDMTPRASSRGDHTRERT